MAKREVKFKNFSLDIAYDVKNLDKKETIVFLHGWGSNKEIMKNAFEKRFKNYKHIYIDLPGFGKSSLPKEPLDSKDYAKIIEEFLKNIKADSDIIAGHSFGGKIATLLKPKLLVLLSSAGIVWKKPLKIRAKIALFKLLKPFKIFRKFFISDDAKGLDRVMYETFKIVVNEDFKEIFKRYDKKALLIWGRDDMATPLKSAKAIHSLIKNSSLYILDGDHYFFLKHPQKIEKIVKEEYEKLSN